MTPELKVGDVVRLRSGAPVMTIVHLGNDNYADVSYFEENLSYRVSYPCAVLVVQEKGQLGWRAKKL